MTCPERAYYHHYPVAEDVMRKHLATIAAVLLAAAVLGVIAVAPFSLIYE